MSQALDSDGGESAVIDVLERNGVTQKGRGAALAAYLCAMAMRLEQQSDAEILMGAIDWVPATEVR